MELFRAFLVRNRRRDQPDVARKSIAEIDGDEVTLP